MYVMISHTLALGVFSQGYLFGLSLSLLFAEGWVRIWLSSNYSSFPFCFSRLEVQGGTVHTSSESQSGDAIHALFGDNTESPTDP